MSVNYHAFQSRGFLFSNSEALSEQWHAIFSNYDPARIASILDLKYDEEYLYLSYFQRPYRLCLADGWLEKCVDVKDMPEKTQNKTWEDVMADQRTGQLLQSGRNIKDHEKGWTDALYFNEAMSIYHLLHYTKDQPLITGIWVPNTEVDGVVSRNPRIPDPLLSPFARAFSGKTAELETACIKAGGTKLNKGDVAYEFSAFPQIRLRLIFWDADEDFPAQVQVLVDKRITDFVHYETAGCMISDLLELLMQ